MTSGYSHFTHDKKRREIQNLQRLSADDGRWMSIWAFAAQTTDTGFERHLKGDTDASILDGVKIVQI
jgi:hypothetical protein